MPLGIVNDQEFEAELNNSSKPEIIKIPVAGRKEGDVEVPNSLRKIIGETAIVDGRKDALDLARQFGISPSSVSAYTNGASSTASYNEGENKPFVKDIKVKIASQARNKLRNALRHITNEKLEAANVKDLAGIAKDMSAIVKDMEPEKQNNGDNKPGVQFVVFAPQFKQESAFETVVAKDNY